MHRLIHALFLLLAACATQNLDTIQMPPRPVPQTQAEVAFVSRLFNTIQPVSIADRREYCGLIGINGEGQFTATEPRKGRESSCLPPSLDRANMTVIASYHTHGAYDHEYLTEVPSFDDMRTDIEDGTDGYVATPGGRLWYIDARAREARMICGVGCLVRDPNHVDDPNYAIVPTYGLWELLD